MAEKNQYIELDPNDRIVCVNISSTYDKNEREDVEAAIIGKYPSIRQIKPILCWLQFMV